MEKGIKHLIKCRCFLPQFVRQENPPLHQFLVFSIFDEDSDEIRQKFVQCNNCGIIHKIIDVCKSEIISGKENMSSIITIEDIKSSLPDRLIAILETHNCDLATWENAAWILENKKWGEFVVLVSEIVDGLRQGKIVRILSETLYKVDSFTCDDNFQVSIK